ncbi:MAG: hypothetical protein ACP5HM_00930 [Anaerolineae bacterium]
MMGERSQKRTSGWRADAVASVALLTALFLIYRRLVAGRVLAGGDLQSYFFPYWAAAARALQGGDLPLWNPYLFSGAPLLANSQAGVFYPLNWPLWLLSGPTLEGMTRTLHLSVLLHLGLAAFNARLLARSLGAGPWGGAMAGLLYAGGGFLGVHVEHLNQLQGLAWLPLVFLLQKRGARGRPAPISILALALILLAGHTQTAFIAAVGLVVFYTAFHVSRFTFPALRFIFSLAPFMLAALIAAVQLLPTFQLAGFSMRAGGLPWREAVSFSVAPWQLHRALLPPYLVAPLLPEGVAYVGFVGLLLTGWGVWQAWRDRVPARLALVVLGGMGLFFALGGYNPLYLLAARGGLPGVAQFRAPARYLALTTLSAAVLAGTGLSISTSTPSKSLSPFPFYVSRFVPLFFILSFVELSFAAESLPHADATAPRAYTDLRPATAHLVAAARADQAEGRPAGRFLSISKMLFQPGDEPDLTLIYEDVLSPDALRAFLVSAKAREVLAPNLPLAFAVPAVDGYDGGLLPLRHYAAFTEMLLPGGTLDGRLRENLEAVPDERWLSLLDVRFLITDKTGDVWIDEIFYDRQFRSMLATGETLTLGWLPTDFDATALHVLAEGEGRVTLTMEEGATRSFPLVAASADAPTVVAWDVPATPVTVSFEGGDGGLSLVGATLVDARTGAFFPLTLSRRFRLVHSGDVKLYEDAAALPRAFLVHRCGGFTDETALLSAMRDPAFDPAKAALFLHVDLVAEGYDRFAPCAALMEAPAQTPAERVEIVAYEPERVEIEVEAEAPGFLVLTDAWYPGWRVEVASLDDEEVGPTEIPILRANLLFRAVPLTPGVWHVTFTYRPRTWVEGAWVSVAGLLAWLGYTLERGVFRKGGGRGHHGAGERDARVDRARDRGDESRG